LLLAKTGQRPAIDEVFRRRTDFQEYGVLLVLFNALHYFHCIHVSRQLLHIQAHPRNGWPDSVGLDSMVLYPLLLRPQQSFQGLPVLVLFSARFQDSDRVVRAGMECDVTNR